VKELEGSLGSLKKQLKFSMINTTRKLINTNENIVGKFPRDFTDGNIPSVYTERITMEKKLKK
jgi:hypothetical protein